MTDEPGDFLGRGWQFPVTTDRGGRIELSSGVTDIEESIRLILATAKGERALRPAFGCGIHDYAFTTVDQSTLTMIETTELTKQYGDITAVDSIDLTVDRGSIHGFVGHNGAGKSTTMQMLVGLITPTGGEAYIDGEPAGSVAATRKIGYAPQEPSFYESMTGRRYLRYMAKTAGVDGDIGERVDELLAQFILTAKSS